MPTLKQLNAFFKIYRENPGNKNIIAMPRAGGWIVQLHIEHKVKSVYELETKRGEIRKFKQLNAVVRLLKKHGVQQFAIHLW